MRNPTVLTWPQTSFFLAPHLVVEGTAEGVSTEGLLLEARHLDLEPDDGRRLVGRGALEVAHLGAALGQGGLACRAPAAQLLIRRAKALDLGLEGRPGLGPDLQLGLEGRPGLGPGGYLGACGLVGGLKGPNFTAQGVNIPT